MSDACIEALLKRRSIRVFKDTEVPLDMVLKAIEVARYAPSAGNKQPWKFIIIRDTKRIESLAKSLRYSKPLMNAKVAVLVLANKEESPTSYMVDASLAAMYFWLALHCMGLGAVWIQTLRNINELLEFVNAPQDYVPVALFAIGWPAEQPEPRERKQLSEITYLEKYGESIKT
ncbi:MAG: nitroreductase family protein [Zestosphaera sp.]